MMKKNGFVALVLGLILINGCEKEKDKTIPTAKGVYIVNEGNFNFGTAEVSFYNPENNEVSNKLFETANGYSLGDVGQSMYVKDSLAFIVVNNSQKVEVVKIPSFKKALTITIAGSSPRYFLPVNDSIAYVTDLYAGKIHVINYRTGGLVKQISTPTVWTERMILNGNKVLVESMEISASATHNAGLTVINTTDHTYINTYKLNTGNTTGIVKDKYGNVWIAKSEDTATHQKAVIYRLNSSYDAVDSVVLDAGHNAINVCINNAGDKIYFLDGGVYSLPVEAGAVPVLVVAGNNRNLYGMAIDPQNGDIYLSDALDFIQPSRIYRYDKNGAEIYSFNAGLISGNFAFSYE